MVPGLAVAVAALVLATVFGVWRRARDGRLRSDRQDADARRPKDTLSPEDIGVPLGERATLVQFSSSLCAPCRATRVLLADVAGGIDGVEHVELDAESRLDLVRRLDVRRTPTTFVLDPSGTITHRASGQPRKAEVMAAVGGVI